MAPNHIHSDSIRDVAAHASLPIAILSNLHDVVEA